jgi:hypothetical protein
MAWMWGVVLASTQLNNIPRYRRGALEYDAVQAALCDVHILCAALYVSRCKNLLINNRRIDLDTQA